MPPLGRAHVVHKEGHGNTALLQKFSWCCYLVQASGQVLRSCLPFLLLIAPNLTHMQAPQGEHALECSILARFLPCFFQFLATVFGVDSNKMSLIIWSAT